jgi:hypothetical protein
VLKFLSLKSKIAADHRSFIGRIDLLQKLILRGVQVIMKNFLLCKSIFVLTLLTSINLFAQVDTASESISTREIDLSQLTGRVVTPNDPEYNAARVSWNLYFGARFPLAIVFVQNKCDALNALNFCRENNITFRIRSGGHSYEGWSNLDGGIVIDVSEMKNIHVNQQKNLAFVQPGVTQGQAVVALGELGLAIPTGLEPDPGLSGVTLGGGIGLSIREFGLACDHLVEVEIILASGKIVRASKTNKYKDLFFACQGGGGGNFGLVTELVYSVISRGDVTYFKIEYPYDTLETLVDTWQHWAPFQTKRLNSALELGEPSLGHDIIGVFSGDQAELLNLLVPVLAIPGSTITALATVPYPESFLFFAFPPTPPQNDKISSTFAYKLLPPEAIHHIKEALDTTVSTGANFFFLAFGGVMKKVSKTATPFWNRNALFYFEWDQPWPTDQPELGGLAIAWVENLRSALMPFGKGSYVNVPDSNIPNPLWQRDYYGRNFKRLEKIKAKYDPDNFFTYELQAIPPFKCEQPEHKHKRKCGK